MGFAFSKEPLKILDLRKKVHKIPLIGSDARRVGILQNFLEELGTKTRSRGEEEPFFVGDGFGVLFDSSAQEEGVEFLMGFKERPGDAGEHDLSDALV